MTDFENTKSGEDTEHKEKKKQRAIDEIGNHVEKLAIKTAESIKKAVDKALSSRNTVLTIRVNKESNTKLNMLVETGLFKSRSESAAFLIQEGIKRQEGLFKKISSKMEEIEKIRGDLKKIVSDEFVAPSDPPDKQT